MPRQIQNQFRTNFNIHAVFRYDCDSVVPDIVAGGGVAEGEAESEDSHGHGEDAVPGDDLPSHRQQLGTVGNLRSQEELSMVVLQIVLS